MRPRRDQVDCAGMRRASAPVKVSRLCSEFFTDCWLSATSRLTFCKVARIASVTSCSALGSAVSTGTPSSSSGTETEPLDRIRSGTSNVSERGTYGAGYSWE